MIGQVATGGITEEKIRSFGVDAGHEIGVVLETSLRLNKIESVETIRLERFGHLDKTGGIAGARRKSENIGSFGFAAQVNHGLIGVLDSEFSRVENVFCQLADSCGFEDRGQRDSDSQLPFNQRNHLGDLQAVASGIKEVVGDP